MAVLEVLLYLLVKYKSNSIDLEKEKTRDIASLFSMADFEIQKGKSVTGDFNI